MAAYVSPALSRFLQQFAKSQKVAQVLIRRLGPQQWELRHVQDENAKEADLRLLCVEELRSWSQASQHGRFRPLRASPDLRRGWRCVASTEAELEDALESLYPGFLADWLAVQNGAVPPMDYQNFTSRQSGMYRLTAKATPEQAAAVVQACCAPRFCLKQRLWAVPNLETDRLEDKSIVPCLEPCALLLEFARKRMRIFQEPVMPFSLSATEVRGLLGALEKALAQDDPEVRTADFNHPSNPRHWEFLRRKLSAALPDGNLSGAVGDED